jgi:hypothetical protein
MHISKQSNGKPLQGDRVVEDTTVVFRKDCWTGAKSGIAVTPSGPFGRACAVAEGDELSRGITAAATKV